jgi:hypothetical protein
LVYLLFIYQTIRSKKLKTHTHKTTNTHSTQQTNGYKQQTQKQTQKATNKTETITFSKNK